MRPSLWPWSFIRCRLYRGFDFWFNGNGGITVVIFGWVFYSYRKG